MDEMDLELANMLRGVEKRDQAFLYKSLELVVRQLRQHFAEHTKNTHPYDDMIDPQDDSLGEDDRDAWSFEDVYGLLNELVQTDLSHGYVELREGEVQVLGEGVYMLDTPEGTASSSLEGGEVLYGTIDGYSVAPLVVIDQATEEPCEIAVPAIWLVLNDADLRTIDGRQIMSSDRMLVPITAYGFSFNKLSVAGDESVAEPEEPYYLGQEAQPESGLDLGIEDVLYNFQNHDFQQLCNDIEADLNYNNYDADVLQERRRESQPFLAQHMSLVEADDRLIISVNDAHIPTGGTVDLAGQNVYYDGPTIMKMYTSWRVMHGFTVLDDSGQPESMIHVLPESIQNIFRTTIE